MSMYRAPAWAVTVSGPTSRIWFIPFILITVPPSATPQRDVEWFEPTPRTGEGYFAGSFRIATISSTDFASTITCGCDTTSPNQLLICAMDHLIVKLSAYSFQRPAITPISRGWGRSTIKLPADSLPDDCREPEAQNRHTIPQGPWKRTLLCLT